MVGHRHGASSCLIGMTDEKDPKQKEPEGLGADELGPAAEAAHEQGWGLNEEERTRQPETRPAHYGGIGYDYGAQDFGDTPAKRDNPDGISDEPSEEQRKAS
jgi:hypothetical protein